MGGAPHARGVSVGAQVGWCPIAGLAVSRDTVMRPGGCVVRVLPCGTDWCVRAVRCRASSCNGGRASAEGGRDARALCRRVAQTLQDVGWENVSRASAARVVTADVSVQGTMPGVMPAPRWNCVQRLSPRVVRFRCRCRVPCKEGGVSVRVRHVVADTTIANVCVRCWTGDSAPHRWHEPFNSH